MSSFFSCRHCGQPITLPAATAPGAEVKCRFCAALTTVPMGVTGGRGSGTASRPAHTVAPLPAAAGLFAGQTPQTAFPQPQGPAAGAPKQMQSGVWATPTAPQAMPFPDAHPPPPSKFNLANPFADDDWPPPSGLSGSSLNPYRPPHADAVGDPFARPSGLLPLASREARLAAVILNMVMLAGWATVCQLITGLPGNFIQGAGGPGNRLVMVFQDVGFLLEFAAFIGFQMVLIARTGQSFGKWLVGIRLAKADSDDIPGFVSSVAVRIGVNGLLSIVPIYLLLDLVFIFINPQRCCLHDLIAGTRVVVKESKSTA